MSIEVQTDATITFSINLKDNRLIAKWHGLRWMFLSEGAWWFINEQRKEDDVNVIDTLDRGAKDWQRVQQRQQKYTPRRGKAIAPVSANGTRPKHQRRHGTDRRSE